MGWFWAETGPSHSRASHPIPSGPNAQSSSVTPPPPPSCPMHNKTTSTLAPPPHPGPPASLASSERPSACPIKHDQQSSIRESPSYVSRLNPLNYMPHSLSNKRDSKHQTINLPLEREASTIPRGDGQGNWEYPSPQQMYNAMLRKGYTDTPAEHVESMVAVHNFLNEGAWDEIKAWEARFKDGLYKGWERCARGEEGFTQTAALESLRRRRGEEESEPKLLRFEGRPGDLTPKARMMSVMAWLYPSQFPDNPPFDRHDWFVQRHLSGGRTQEVRYCIDYRSGPPEPTGEPVFYLDVRPAVDGPTAACERVLRWGGDVWWRASGASVREELARQKR